MTEGELPEFPAIERALLVAKARASTQQPLCNEDDNEEVMRETASQTCYETRHVLSQTVAALKRTWVDAYTNTDDNERTSIISVNGRRVGPDDDLHTLTYTDSSTQWEAQIDEKRIAMVWRWKQRMDLRHKCWGIDELHRHMGRGFDARAWFSSEGKGRMVREYYKWRMCAIALVKWQLFMSKRLDDDEIASSNILDSRDEI